MADAPNLYVSGQYLENNPRWHEEDSTWKVAAITKMLSRHHLQPSRIAEIGCGAGQILVELANNLDQDVKYSGFDISPQAFEICREKTTDRIAFYLSDMLENNSEIFDLALAIDVFEHVPDYIGFLTKFRATATNHIFHIPLDIHVSAVIRATPFQVARETVGHLHYFTKETALATLRHAGYQILDSFYTSNALESPSPHRSLQKKLLRLPRQIAFGLNEDLAARVLGGFSLLVLTRQIAFTNVAKL